MSTRCNIHFVPHDHNDIEYIWTVDCSNLDDNGLPTVTHRTV